MKIKPILIALLFLNCSLINAQNEGIVTYTVNVLEDEDDFMQEQMKQVVPDIFSYVDQLIFKLYFNDQASYFTLEDKLYDNKPVIDATALIANYTSPLVRIDNKTYLKKDKNTPLNAGKWIVEDAKIDWDVSQEAKQINDYTVYKATGVYKTGNSLAGYKKTELIAWFCPEIPKPYSPLNFGNLPGLIFEVSFKNVSYGLTKIEYKPVKIPEVDIENNVTMEEDETMTMDYFGM